jgi:CubicO group peptidase (beta-lactamase class C family)
MDNLPQEFMVGLHSHYDLYRAMRPVPTSIPASVLKRQSAQIAPVYGYDGRIKTLANYLADHPVTGLLIARSDEILFEHYQYGRTDHDRFTSWSMAKTVVGLLVGIALEEGAIRSIDDRASAYVPELAGTEYGATPIRALLQMSSGIAFTETYQRGDDINKLSYDLFAPNAPGAIAAVKRFNTRVAPPGTKFNYSSADTEVLGLVLRGATRTTLADYLSTRIWKKLGAEADAAWDVDPTGQEIAFCCMVATLRDWARVGLMLANDGFWNGQQIVPHQWVIASTTVSPDSYLAPGRLSPILGYGYQTWISAGERRRFSLIGIRGQSILIDPVSKMVLVHTAVRLNAAGGPSGVELAAVWYAVLAQYGPR